VQRASKIAGATAVAGVVIVAAGRRFGVRSRAFAVVVVWAPMAWLGTVSRLATPRLPARWHELRPFERSGRLYELLGVRAAKAVLRRGPLAAFNPRLHLPADPTPEHLAELDQRMRDAEAAHTLLFAASLGIAGHAAARGWWTAARWTLASNLVMNGYPVMLQRYNRALLQQRGPSLARATPGPWGPGVAVVGRGGADQLASRR
jgi:hypothetical protein